MRRTTAVSIVALGTFAAPAFAQQTGTLNDNLFGQQGQVFQPQPQFDNQTIFYDPNTGLPVAPPPGFNQALPQPGFGQQPGQFQPQPQQNFGQQPQQNFGQQPQFIPQPQPSFPGQQPTFQPQQPPQFQQIPDPNTLGLAPPQPEQPLFAPEQPFQQPQNGSVLPQPGAGYNPPQPSNQQQTPAQPGFPEQPQAPAQAQDNVPYYDRARPAPPQQPIEVPSQAETPNEIAGPAIDLPASNDPAFQPQQTVEPAIAQPPSPAGPFASGSDRGPTMAAELDELLAVGERYRAASPGFLEDLKALASKYRDPLPQAPVAVAPVEGDPSVGDLASTDPGLPIGPPLPGEEVGSDVTQGGSFTPPDDSAGAVTNVPPIDPGSVSFAYLEDYFTDGEIQNNPPWRTRQGDWSIDPTYGLRAKAPEKVSDAPIRPKELLKALLTSDAPDVESDAPKPQAALIESQISIGNAFSLGARIVDHAGKGTAHFIMHQGGANWLGYRLELRSGPQPVVVLTRRGSNGYKDITKVSAPGFTTGKQHELRWARLSDGQMIVLLNNRPIITSRDTVFREDWKGFAFFNAGGDVSIRALRISAPVER